ncbi:MAG: hypothetical protein GY873_09935 [Bosea sp.]|uniref:hypothetical protein n=1 Tax=Bosea sp. (in: a-proteobacteria) TaxID=1871050 RepID=UPI0023A29E68|nr:hypothetical protein [Bosea sp. (in: a-proteobacteria)]MCP4734497.1 hypothetical protein [Bosea sp. (in: a-proteobacteria)]
MPLLAIVATSATVAQAADDACTAPDGTELVRLAGLDRHGDPQLADGRTIRLAGLAPRQSDAERERFAAQLARWHGREFRLAPLGGPDRWGRLPARLLTAEGTDALAGQPDLSAALLATGAASRLPEPGLAACNELWRKAEPRPTVASKAGSPAPAATQGNFAAVARPVIDGHDAAAMKAQAGRIVVVEGRIAAVGERAQRTYLNFERRRGTGGSIVLSRALWRDLQRAGWTASALTGKRVRVSGVIEGRDGLLIEAQTRSALELID